jgi:hypothetical protein
MDQNKKKDDDEHVTHCCPFVFAECKFVHHHFLYKVTKKKQKLDNDNEHVVHNCPLCSFKKEDKEELCTCCHLLCKGTQKQKKGRQQACGPSSSLIFKK